MNKSRKTSNLYNVVTYDESGNIVLPAGLTLGTDPSSLDNSTKAASTAWIRTYVAGQSYATSASVTSAIAALVDTAPTTLDTLNELAAALGDDPNFATTVTASIGTKVPQARTITINGTAYDLSADRSWTIAAGLTSFNTRTGAITLTNTDVSTALGYIPYSSLNPSGYITTSSLAAYLPLAGGTMTGQLTVSYGGAVISLRNTTGTGTSNYQLGNDLVTNGAGTALFGSTFVTSGQYRQSGAYFYSNQGGGLTLHAEGANSIYLATNGGTAMTINSAQVVSFTNTITGNISGSARTLLFSGDSAKQIQDGQWAGGGSYPGYTFSGGNSRFGFSSSGGVIDVYADGNFYATDSSHLVLHAGNYSSYSVPLSGGTMTGKLQINSSVNTVGGALQIYTTTAQQYPQIYSNGDLEAMWNYKNSNAEWYVGLRTTAQLVGNTGFHFYNTTNAQSVAGFDINGNHYALGSSRSPIFYDLNDTGYYGDFAGTSSLWGLAIRGDNGANSTSNQIFFWGAGGTTTSAIGFKSNAAPFASPTGSGDGYNTYLTMDTPGRGWVFRRGTGGTDFSAAYTAGWILNNGIAQFNSSIRAPIFYDSEDTGYYLDPSAGGSTPSLKVAGNIDLIARSASWAEGIRIRVPGSSVWGGIRFTRDRAGDDGNWGVGFTGLNATDDLTFYGTGGGSSAIKLNLTQGGTLTASGDIVAYSDKRVKTNVNTIQDALEKVMQLRGVSYNRTDVEDQTDKIGVIAQETQVVVPEVVHVQENGFLGVAYGNFAGLFIEAFKEQQSQIASQGAQITELMEIIKTMKGL